MSRNRPRRKSRAWSFETLEGRMVLATGVHASSTAMILAQARPITGTLFGTGTGSVGGYMETYTLTAGTVGETHFAGVLWVDGAGGRDLFTGGSLYLGNDQGNFTALPTPTSVPTPIVFNGSTAQFTTKVVFTDGVGRYAAFDGSAGKMTVTSQSVGVGQYSAVVQIRINHYPPKLRRALV